MSLFGKKYNFETDLLPQSKANRKFQHLDRVVKANAATVREPRMDNGGATVVFLPYPDFDAKGYKAANQVLSDRNSDEPRDYSPWLFSAMGVRKFGKNPITLLFDTPDSFPKSEHPIQLIWDTVKRTVATKQVVQTPFGSSESEKWKTVLDGDEANKVYSSICKPDLLLIGNAVVYKLGEEDFALGNNPPLGGAPDDPQVVFVMTRAAGLELLTHLDKRDAVTGACAVHFYDRKQKSCPAMANALKSVAPAAGSAGFGQRRSAPLLGGENPNAPVAYGYGVYVSDTVSGLANDPPVAANHATFVEVACKKVKPWEQVLQGHTPNECAAIVANHCGLPLSILYHAWKSHPEWYSDEIKRGLLNPVTVEVKAPTPPAEDFPAGPTTNAAPWGTPKPPTVATTTFAGGDPADDDDVDPAMLEAARNRLNQRLANRNG